MTLPLSSDSTSTTSGTIAGATATAVAGSTSSSGGGGGGGGGSSLAQLAALACSTPPVVSLNGDSAMELKVYEDWQDPGEGVRVCVLVFVYVYAYVYAYVSISVDVCGLAAGVWVVPVRASVLVVSGMV